MYIIAIGWLYVTVLMALTETSVVAGVLTFLFYGLFPVALLVWLLVFNNGGGTTDNTTTPDASGFSLQIRSV